MSVLNITSENFQKEVMESKIPVILDFWAPWCGPCKMFSPIVDQVAEELADRAKVGKVNVDEQQNLAVQYEVMSIPTAVIIKEGKVVKRSVGLISKEELMQMI